MAEAPDEQDQSPSERAEEDPAEGETAEASGNPPATTESDESVSEDINEAFEPDPSAS